MPCFFFVFFCLGVLRFFVVSAAAAAATATIPVPVPALRLFMVVSHHRCLLRVLGLVPVLAIAPLLVLPFRARLLLSCSDFSVFFSCPPCSYLVPLFVALHAFAGVALIFLLFALLALLAGWKPCKIEI